MHRIDNLSPILTFSRRAVPYMKMTAIKRIPGIKINLRPITKDDAASIYTYARNRSISRYTFLPHPYTRKDADEWVITSSERNASGIDFNMGIELPASGEIIGMISLNNIDVINRNAELGYWLGKPFWGKGFLSADQAQPYLCPSHAPEYRFSPPA